MAEKLVVHKVGPDKNSFTDITKDVGDVDNLSASALAAKLAEYARANNLDIASVVAEAV